MTFRSVGSYTPDDALFDLGPLATNVGGFVVVADAGGGVFWVWNHSEFLTVVFHISTCKSVVDGSAVFFLGP